MAELKEQVLPLEAKGVWAVPEAGADQGFLSPLGHPGSILPNAEEPAALPHAFLNSHYLGPPLNGL